VCITTNQPDIIYYPNPNPSSKPNPRNNENPVAAFKYIFMVYITNGSYSTVDGDIAFLWESSKNSIPRKIHTLDRSR